MRAVDTNVIVRFLTRDDEAQFQRTNHLFEQGDIFIATTVLLEVEWVLRSTYRFSRARIVQSLRDVAGTIGVQMEDGRLLAIALDRFDGGMDFADALHLQSSKHCSAFFTFDRAMMDAAGEDSGVLEP